MTWNPTASRKRRPAATAFPGRERSRESRNATSATARNKAGAYASRSQDRESTPNETTTPAAHARGVNGPAMNRG